MKKNVIIINGIGGVGKSTFISLIKEIALELNIEAYELSTADMAKKMARICGWSGSKTQEDRILISDIKIAIDKWNNIPIKYIFDRIDNDYNNTDKDKIFFVNSREPQDILAIHEECKIRNIPCTELQVINSNSTCNNEVPELLDGILASQKSADTRINNSGTLKDLREKACLFLADYLLETPKEDY